MKKALKQKKTTSYVSEDYLDRKLSVLKQELKGKILEMREEMTGMREEMTGMREEHKQYKDEVLTKLDDISGQLENLQEDKILSIHQAEELQKQVEDHEKRIKHLEKIPQPA